MSEREMDAWVVAEPGPMRSGPLRRVRLPIPVPTPYELLIRVSVCAVCRTDLHLAEGDLAPRRPSAVPGHEIVGTVVEAGTATHHFRPGDRVGVAWLAGTCGVCDSCRAGRENLCGASAYTGWDLDGGFAQYAVVAESYAYALPDGYTDEEAAPLLCAGIIGHRALRKAELPDKGILAIYGFGASAHLTLQVALAQGATVHVLTRSPEAQDRAMDLGAASAGTADAQPPEAVDSAILFAPAGELVPVALQALRPGGTLAVAGIHLSDIPSLNYQRHLFRERTLRSVTANTRADGRDFLETAARHRLKVITSPYAFEEADRALADLAGDRVKGAAVLRMPSD